VADGCTAALLGHRHEGDAMGVEQLHQFGEVCQGTGEPVDLVDDDNIDPAVPDISQQAERRPIAPALAV
jgi:hypothetical protein